MQAGTLQLLRCPKCIGGSLVPHDPSLGSLFFGPARCTGCSTHFPVHEGLIDLVVPGEKSKESPLQQAMELPWVARSWERYVRPAVDVLLARAHLDEESEYTVVRNMLGTSVGPIMDLGCGSGLILRRLARDFRESRLVGVDLSRTMLEEALAQIREDASSVDLVRARAPPLPFVDHSFRGIVAINFFHLVGDLECVLREVARVLKPRGVLVASTYETAGLGGTLHRQAGLYPRSDDELRSAASAAGLIRFERMKVASLIIMKAELP
jgi:SAM-dependent methyltransferase